MCRVDADDEYDDDFEPWTDAGAVALQTAGDALADAVRSHARTLAGLSESRDIRAVFAASEVLLPVVLAYADAQFNLTGNSFPFGPLHQFADEDDDEDDGDSDEGEAVGSGLSVLSRQDFRVTDDAAVLAAGRTAYQSLWPDDPPSAATDDVSHIGRALYQYAHLNGWNKLTEMTGLVPVGATTVVHANEDLLQGDPDEWPAEPFAIEAPVLYSQSDIYE